MKKHFLFITLILMLILLSAGVSANKYSNLQYLEIKQTISNDIQIIPLKNQVVLEYFETNLYLFPQNTYRQQIIENTFNPEPAQITYDSILFRTEDYTQNNIGFNLETKVRTNGNLIPITKKVSFPLKDVPQEVSIYTEFTESIDSNDEIKKTASNLAAGIDDLYELEFVLATWVEENIHYNLSTLTADANKPSSWVIQEGEGVCDEITNLFISLNRELGIPARFISGVAYTDSDLFDYPWGNHGWAEVYFPDIGWVPYDITYRQFGYVDASHISLRKDVDGFGASAYYSHKGQQDTYDIQTGPLDFESTVLKEGPLKDKEISMKIYPQEETIGFDAYNVIYLELENTKNTYLVEFVQMANTLDIYQEAPLFKFVFLKPYETKVIPFLIKSNEDLDPKLIYSYPFTAYVQGESVTTTVKVQSKGEKYYKEYMTQFLDEEEDKVPIEISCYSKENIMINENFTITCKPFNDATLPIRVCLENKCMKIETYDQESTFDLTASKLGIQTVSLIQANKGTSTKTYHTFKVMDNAKLEIFNASLDSTIEFNEKKSLKFYINKTSFSPASNVTITVKHNLFEDDWNFSTFDETKEFEFNLAGHNLKPKENKIEIQVEYYNSFNEKQVISQTKTINLVNLKFSDKLIISANIINLKTIDLMAKILNKDSSDQTIRNSSILVLFLLIFILLTIIKFLFKASKWLIKNMEHKKSLEYKPKIQGTKRENDYKPKTIPKKQTKKQIK